MIRIAEALDDDGLLRFWGKCFLDPAESWPINCLGFSYGTVLGATVAAMFPEKIDKLVLDGVLNPHEYYAGKYVFIPVIESRNRD